MERSCDVCGVAYVARRSTSRYCSTRCRTRSSRAGGDVGKVTPLKEPAPVPVDSEVGPVAAVTAEALGQAGRLETPLGQACMVLARRLDDPRTDTGSAIAAVAARLESLLAAATRGGGAASAPQQLQDELAERRRKHGA